MPHPRGLHDVSNFALADASISTQDTSGAVLQFGKMRLRRALISLDAGQGPCLAVIYVRFNEIVEPLASEWIRGYSVISGDAAALLWLGELVTPENSGIWARVRNDSGAEVTVNLSYWGETV